MGKRPQAPDRPGPKPWGSGPPGDLAHRPLGPGSRHSHSLPASQVFNFLLRRYHNPQSADLGGRFPKAELYSSMRGGVPVFAPAFQPLGRAPSPWGPGQQALSPASRSRIPKMPRCSSAHEKPGLLHRLISCARSLQPSLTFLLRRNNKVQGVRS